MLGDGLAKFTGSALDAFGVDDASDIASGVGTVGRFAQGVDGVIGGDLSKLGALSGQLGGVEGDDDGFDINYLAGGNDDAGDAPDYQQAYDAPAFEQPVYEPPPTEFEQRMEAIDEVADTTDNFFDGL